MTTTTTTTTMTVGVDAHKRNCTACTFEGQTKKEVFEFPTTNRGLSSFTTRIPDGSVVVIESSTTGKALSRLLSDRYQVHMIAPPETKPSVKTNKRDAEKIAKEDMLGYTRRCYIPSKQIEEMRSTVSRQMRIGEKISGVKSQIHSLIERNMLQSDFEDLSDIFGVEGLERIASLKQASSPGHGRARDASSGTQPLRGAACPSRDGGGEDG